MPGWSSGSIPAALGAAATWGVGDFSGGMAVKTAGMNVPAALRVILLSHCTSLTVLLLIVTLRGDPFPHGLPLLCGLAAGVTAALSLSAFYIALARGSVGISAALSGILTAAIPALVSCVIDGLPGLRKTAGFLIAVLAIWLIASSRDREAPGTLWLALGAGAGFGIYFVLLRYAGTAGPIWPMATARMGSVATASVILLAGRRPGGPPLTRALLGWVLGAALFDTSGNLLFVASTRGGRLDVAAVLASLYPASTILLAAWLLHERPTRRQVWGMAVAGAAVALIAG